MKNNNIKSIFGTGIFFVLSALILSMAVMPETTGAKSLYVITDVETNPQPLQAYDIGINGALTFQTENYIPRVAQGAVGLASDSDNGYLFVTYEESTEISFLDAATMTIVGSFIAPDAGDLGEIVYDHEKELLYCVDRGTNLLYVYRWDAIHARLTKAAGSPFSLRRATAYGIALDEINDVLYVANGTNEIYAYQTSDWSLLRAITVSRVAVSVAVDTNYGYLYSGGEYAGNQYLTQYCLDTGAEKEVQVEPDAGVMDLSVDSDTGLVYMCTGRDQRPGGDNLIVYDKNLHQIDKIPSIGNHPSALVIPGKDIGYNPLNLAEDVSKGASMNTHGQLEVTGKGAQITYTISFDNLENDYDVTDLVIVDTLPRDVIFICADEDNISGVYDAVTHTYTWTYPTLSRGAVKSFDLTVQIKDGVEFGTSFTNYVTINSKETPQTTKRVKALLTCNPLNIRKTVKGVLAGQTKMVDANEEITYRISFNNNDNDFRATEVTIVDILPEEVSFVKADYDQSLGLYNADTHTYTWYYPPLEPGDATTIELTVRVKPDVVPGTTVTNIAMIDSKQTPETTSSVDCVTSGEVNRFNLSKTVLGAIAEVEKVAVNEEVTYYIYFDSNDIVQTVTNVSLIDTLPDEVTFIKADGEGLNGHYDKATHTYIWSYPLVEPGQVFRLELTVKVNEDVALGKTITNSVTIDAEQTPPTTASVDIITDEGGWRVDRMDIIPNIIRRHDAVTELTAVLVFPEGIRSYDVSSEPLILFPGNIKATEQSVDEIDGRTIATVVFNKTELLNAVPGFYGSLPVEVLGKFTSGQSFYGTDIIHIAVDMQIVPDTIRRNGAQVNFKAVLQLPGKKASDISTAPAVFSILSPENFEADIEEKSRHIVSTNDGVVFNVWFGVDELMNATPGYYGNLTVIVRGTLKGTSELPEQSFYGKAEIRISRFAGN
jgi:uncharacterized repeat protein (TIGR01451 family)/fimbrial isopeptide formation D2 family protein